MKVLFGRGLVTKYLLTVLTSVSFEDCKHECATRPLCGLALYQRSHVCELHSARASRSENILEVPGSIVVTNIVPIDTCDTCVGDIDSKRECGPPDEIYYTMHRGNMYSVGNSALVNFPLLRTPRLITCLNNGKWKFEPKRGFCPECRDCNDIQTQGHTESGVYFINETFYFLCTFDGSGKAWLTFQKRLDGSVEFYNNWEGYENGFGFMESEFWLGLDNLHWILSSFPDQYELRVDLEMFNGSSYFALYSTFDLAGAEDEYRLHVDGYNGTAGDSLTPHNWMQFTTYDRDNDYEENNCAERFHGAWWYSKCHTSNLNGRYYQNGDWLDIYAEHVHWVTITTFHTSLKTTEMRIRRRIP